MQEYPDKAALTAEIGRAAEKFIAEFADIAEADGNLRLEEGERTPFEILAYQLGWLSLIESWNREEAAGREAATPAPGIKWNQMGLLHERFYADHAGQLLAELSARFKEAVGELCGWIGTLSEDELFKPGGRKWARSTPADWPLWKWVHINTVAPFKTFRAKTRRWKKLRAEMR